MVNVEGFASTWVQYGAMGAMLAVLLGLFTWTFRLILVRFLRAFDGMLTALNAQNKEHALHVAATTDNHRAVMTAAHNNHAAVTEKLETLRREQRERRTTKS